MQWDTLDYHLYAGFSALHDRFALDYFAAGGQSYLNPYAYVPFYLLATSRLTALEVATILALFQSAILWLSYELAASVARPDGRRSPPRNRRRRGDPGIRKPRSHRSIRLQFRRHHDSGAGARRLSPPRRRAAHTWRLAYRRGRSPARRSKRIQADQCFAGGIAGSRALVPTVRLGRRLGHMALLCLCIAAGFALVAWPWSLQLERHFGNPFLPLLNGLFHSRSTRTDLVSTTASFHRRGVRHCGVRSPSRHRSEWCTRKTSPPICGTDSAHCRNLSLVHRLAGRWMARQAVTDGPRPASEDWALLALGCAFLVDWIMWLARSGNSRYLLPMACVAGVLAIVLLFRLLARWPRLRYGVVAVVLGIQIHQVYAGTDFRPLLPWNDSPWFGISKIPAADSAPALYFSVGVQSHAFIVPFLPRGSGFIDLHGDYVLGPGGANGAHILSLIRRFSPHLKVLVADRAGRCRSSRGCSESS